MVMRELNRPTSLRDYADWFGGPTRILADRAHDLDLIVLDAPHLFDRPGGPYQSPGGTDWPDNPRRFAALARAAASIGQGALPGYVPEIVHAHDWQAGLAPAYLVYDGGPRPATVMTVHNLAFQGQFPASLLASLGLPLRSFAIDGVEYYGMIGFLKAGLRFADRITTVSPTYAEEIRTAASGMGLDGLLRGRADVMRGIVNGIDVAVWNPATDAALSATYDIKTLGRRAANKRALQKRFGLENDPDAPLFGVISRLSWQKGLDLLLGALPTLFEAGAQLALVGSGDAMLQAAFVAEAQEHPQSMGCFIGYDETLAHLMQGGCDAILVPSRFEPCGLTQLCAQRYGAVPIVSHVGGLVDTVVDATTPELLASRKATGIQFSPVTVAGLQSALERAIALYRDRPTWRAMQRAGMKADVSWRGPAAQYAALYRELVPSS
jgi:starch synthase